MSVLALSMVAAPYRALLIGDGGSRTPVAVLDDSPTTSVLEPAVYVDEQGAEVGGRAVQAADYSGQGLFWFGNQPPAAHSLARDGATWRHRDLYALIFRRALLAASSGAHLPELALIVPPSVGAAGRRDLEAAALIAGAPYVHLFDVGDLLPREEYSGGVKVLFVELTRENLRLELCEMEDAGNLRSIQQVISPEWSSDALSARIANECGRPDALARAAKAQISGALKDWGAKGDRFLLLPNTAGPPCPLFVPAALLAKVADDIVAEIQSRITAVRLEDLFRIRLQGALTVGLESRFRKRASAATIVLDSSAALLDMIEVQALRPQLSAGVFPGKIDDPALGPETAASMDGRLQAGRPLALADCVIETFPVDQYGKQGRFAFYQARGARPQRLVELQIPPLFQGRANIRLSARVCAETRDFILLQCSVGFADNEVLALYDRQLDASQIIDRRVVNALNSIEKPRRETRTF